MKLSTISLAVAFGLGISAPVIADNDEDIAQLKQQVLELQKQAGGNHLKFNVDYRVPTIALNMSAPMEAQRKIVLC